MLNRTQQHRHALETLARLSATIELLGAASLNLRDAQPGYPTSSGGGGTSPRLDAAGNPPGLDRYLSVPDPAAQATRRIDALLRSLLNEATELHSLVNDWAIPVADQPTIQRATSGGDCLACGRYCSGNATTGDRLRAGLCDACRKHWRRWQHDNPTRDRGDWMLVRRRTLIDEADEVA